MYAFRSRMADEHELEMLVHVNTDGLEMGINPFTHGSAAYTDVMKTESLKQAITKHGFDAAFGGGRRDEEHSRAKERVFSFRSAQHRWDPKSQRPELWRLYNARKRKGESIRVFPLSNWTELDVWQYIYLEQIPIVPAVPGRRAAGGRARGHADHGRRRPHAAGRWRAAGAQEGPVPDARLLPADRRDRVDADTLGGSSQEMMLAPDLRARRTRDRPRPAGSMERKKQEGYF